MAVKKIIVLGTLLAFVLCVLSFTLIGDEKAEKTKKAENNKEKYEIGHISKKYEPAPFSHWKHQDEYKVGGNYHFVPKSQIRQYGYTAK